MKKRQRKKWLKKHGKYVSNSDLWSLDITIAEFVLPRLKKFKKENDAYPGVDEMNTPEKWDEALDKMILAFEYVISWDDWWFGNPKYDYSSGLHMKTNKTSVRINFEEDDWVKEIKENNYKERDRRRAVIDEGLQLFAKWFQHLWI